MHFSVFCITVSVPGPRNEDLTTNEVEDRDTHEDMPKLVSLANNGIATPDIEEDILTAQERGVTLVKANVTLRLVEKSVSFFDPVKKNKFKTLETLYKTSVVTKQKDTKIIKADNNCSILQQQAEKLKCRKFYNINCHRFHSLWPKLMDK